MRQKMTIGMTLEHKNKIPVEKFKTACCYTGIVLDAYQEEKITLIKEKLILKALSEHKKITTCGTKCFQIKNKQLLFYFNTIEKTTKIISDSLKEHIFINAN